jgi:hypothetical protein
MTCFGRAAWAPTRRFLAVLAAASVAAACGGGGDGDDSGTESAATSAEGIYVGSLAGGTPNYFEKLVLENNEVWLVYGTQSSAGPTQFLGLVNGTGTYSGGTLTATAAKDFGVAPAATGTFSASYRFNSKSLVRSVSGTANAAGKSLTLTGNNNIGNYFYSVPASPTELAGTWAIPVASGAPGALSVNSTGGFSLSVAGCAGSGTMVPRASGKNVFNVTMTFGAAPCSFPGVAFSGVAYVATNSLLNTGGGLKVLIHNGTQTTGFVLVGTR